MELDDRAAVERACAGDQDAFGALVERHSRNLFRLGFRMTGNEQDAEDVVQETWLRAYRRLGSFDGRAGFGTWLFSIAVNYSRDLIRARQRRQPQSAMEDPAMPNPIELVAAGSLAPDRLAYANEIRRRLGAALNRLTPMERTAFVLRHYEGQCLDTIGQVLGVPANAAKQAVFRAVQKLRRALEPAVSSVP